jgi:hypothetical protein
MERVMMQANRVITIRSEAGNSMPAKISIQGRRKLTRRNNFLVKLKCPPAMTKLPRGWASTSRLPLPGRLFVMDGANQGGTTGGYGDCN